MGGVCTIARVERGEACTEIWWGNLWERDQWRDPGVDGKIILRCIFRIWDKEYGLH
jgi:hypothetical protein